MRLSWSISDSRSSIYVICKYSLLFKSSFFRSSVYRKVFTDPSEGETESVEGIGTKVFKHSKLNDQLILDLSNRSFQQRRNGRASRSLAMGNANFDNFRLSKVPNAASA